jgi:hypothetical protein
LRERLNKKDVSAVITDPHSTGRVEVQRKTRVPE